MIARGHKTRWAAAFVTAAMVLPSAAGAQSESLARQDSLETAEAFEQQIEQFLDTLPLEREKFEVRINRCEDPRGGMRDDVYAVWIGARLRAPENDADTILAGLAATWKDDGWTIIRDRQLDNGGVNVAAAEPRTGNVYSLDSGFAADPTGYVVSYFSTTCFSDPSGAAPFGSVSSR